MDSQYQSLNLKSVNFSFLQVCHLEFDRKDISMNKLAATTLESKFHVYDTRTQHPTKGFACVTEKVVLFILPCLLASYKIN